MFPSSKGSFKNCSLPKKRSSLTSQRDLAQSPVFPDAPLESFYQALRRSPACKPHPPLCRHLGTGGEQAGVVLPAGPSLAGSHSPFTLRAVKSPGALPPVPQPRSRVSCLQEFAGHLPSS